MEPTIEKIKFQIFDDNPKLKAEATIIDGRVAKMRLLFHSGRGYYYSFLNSADTAFEEQYPQFCNYQNRE